MATSNSTDFNRTRNELLNGALRLIGKAGRGKTASAADIYDAAEALEMMVKAWQGSGIHIWKLRQATLFVDKGTSEYSFPSGNCTHSFVETTLSASAAASASTITVTSIAGMTSGDFLGIELDEGTVQWTTINGAPSGSTVTLTTALTGAAASTNVVYAYTTKIVRPLRVIEARRRDSSDVPIDVVTRNEYFDLPNKTDNGSINQVYYDAQLTTGKFYIWPTGSTATDKVEIDLMLPIEDFDSSNINPDFPQEWLLALKWNLASHLGPEYGIDLNRQMYLDGKAHEFLDIASDFDDETGSIYFQVDTQ